MNIESDPITPGSTAGRPARFSVLAVVCVLPLCAVRSVSDSVELSLHDRGAESRRPDERSADVITGLTNSVEIVGRPPVRMTLDERMRASGTTGVSIAVVRGGRLGWARGFGVLSEASGVPVSSDSLFQAASISKPVTAIAALHLVDAGVLDLDVDVNDTLTTWHVSANEHTRVAPVTIRRILSHSGGFTNGSVGSYPAGEAVPTLVDALRGDPPSTEPPATVEYAPGSRSVYSGGGYSVLQQLLIDVSGQPFDAFMAKLVLKPMDMADSCFTQPLPVALEDRAAVGHEGSGHPIPGRWETLPEMAAGGLWSTSPDLARMTISLHRAWAGSNDELLSPKMVRLMMTPVLDSRGLGFEIDHVGGLTRYRHTGANHGYRAIVVGFIETGDAAVILTNGDDADELRYEILRSIARVYGWPGYEVTAKTAMPFDAASAAELAGVYGYGGGYATTITVDDGRVYAQLTGGDPAEVFFEAPDRLFSLGGVEYRIVREAGTVTAIIADLGGGTTLRGRRQ